MSLKQIGLTAACIIVPIAWGALWAMIFSRSDKSGKKRVEIDYMI